MEVTINDVFKRASLAGNPSAWNADRYFYERQLNLHIWTLFNRESYTGTEFHYNETTDEWSDYPWRIEDPVIQSYMFERSRDISCDIKDIKKDQES